MELPDCPPGAEGYHDSVTEVPKKLGLDENCTKAEQEFNEHLNSLKIKIENGETRCMVERRGRDISGKWIYLCYPCAAMCSGESILQTHISGKKHKTKLAMRNIWPMTIFEDHPYIVSEKGGNATKGGGATEKILQKMAEEVDLYNKNPSDLDGKYNKYRANRCHIQDTFDNIKAPLIGLEYLVEHPPEQSHYEPSYMCTLCSKQGHPRTIVNHMTCFWHRCNYLTRHFSKASALLTPYRAQTKYREGVSVIMNRLAQRIEDKFGRLKPVNIDKEEYEKDKERIHQWIHKGPHFSETSGHTLEEVVDVDLITSLHKSKLDVDTKLASKNRDPSPPTVPAPTKPHFNSFTRSASRQERRAGSMESLSDVSDDQNNRRPNEREDRPAHTERNDPKRRHHPYGDSRQDVKPPIFRSRYALKNPLPDKHKQPEKQEKRAPNYDYKVKLAEEKRKQAEDSAKKTLAYHEKNPEKHPLYPEEWKKFWNRRYKEIQAEGKDPSKYDFKPEWIVFWTSRMKELHEEELRVNIVEIYRKLCMSPPDMSRRSAEPKRVSSDRRRSPDTRRRSPEPRRRSLEPRRRSPDPRRRSPDPRRRSPEPRRRSPEPRRRSPDYRRISPGRPDFRRDRRSPDYRRMSPRRRSIDRRHSPPRPVRIRSRSPLPSRARSPARTHITLESVRRSRSPLSRRGEASRNRSPQPAHNHNPGAGAGVSSMQTVMISDDELKPDDGLSPWNSDNDIDSLGSLPDARSPVRERERSHTGSLASHASRPRRDYPTRTVEPQDFGPAENVVATLRMLVALEDYLGSLGPKIVDLLTEALKLEKDRANSSEDLLERESCVVLMETAKEKLKGAVQAGLVAGSAAPAVRAAVVRVAATLHEADTRARRRTQSGNKSTSAAPVPVAGVGEVDRAQIAQQMAAALIAQGKTDVSSEELAQLVDAVVGMAEAKKREAEVKKKVEARALAEKASRPTPAPAPALSGTASALQMLQSAYDENDKKAEKEDIPDAMDGLSDSDLETLLKNFNELSAEEQHSLIAYLKKLEAREPQRVERLRQYVSAAATTTPKPEEPPAKKVEEAKLVTIESDDDDYTVEDVFKSVTQKVKEDQIRQEMEIVKKSLEETKPAPSPAPEAPKEVPIVDLTTINMSSASDLLALVQASIQSTSTANVSVNKIADVVTSNTQPRSFGDRPEAPMSTEETVQPLMQKTPLNPTPQQSAFGNQGGYRPPNQRNFGLNRNFNEPFNQSPSPWEQTPNMSDNRGPMNNMPDNRGPMNNMSDNRGPMNNMSDNRGPMGNMSDNRGPMGNMPDNRGPMGNMSDNRGPMGNMSDNRGPMSNMPDNRGPMGNMSDNRGPMSNMSDNRGPMGNMSDNRGPMSNMSDNRGPMANMSDNRSPMGNISDNRSPMGNVSDNRDPMGNMSDNRGPMGNMSDNRGLMNNMSDIRGPMNNMTDNRGLLGNMPDNIGSMGNMSDNRGPMNNMMDNRGPMNNRGPMMGQRGQNFGRDQFNQGPRGNFMNGRQDNYDNRQNDMNQHFGNQGNFRGRGGRGNFGGQRGRGRGYY